MSIVLAQNFLFTSRSTASLEFNNFPISCLSRVAHGLRQKRVQFEWHHANYSLKWRQFATGRIRIQKTISRFIARLFSLFPCNLESTLSAHSSTIQTALRFNKKNAKIKKMFVELNFCVFMEMKAALCIFMYLQKMIFFSKTFGVSHEFGIKWNLNFKLLVIIFYVSTSTFYCYANNFLCH